MIGREDSIRDYRDRACQFFGLAMLFFGVIAGRLVYLQLWRGEELNYFSERNHLKPEIIYSPRGVILDRSGKVLVENRAAFDLVVLPSVRQSQTSLIRLSKLLEISPEVLSERMAEAHETSNALPLVLQSDISKDFIAKVETDFEGFPGVSISPSVHRRYPLGEISAQILGFLGQVGPEILKSSTVAKLRLQPGDFIGKMGLEKQYDVELRGKDGAGFVEVDSRGRRQSFSSEASGAFGFVSEESPVQGATLELTLDSRLTAAANHAMRSRDLQGSVVAVDPNSGEILAMVNSPSFSPEVLSSKKITNAIWNELVNDKSRPLRNRAVQDVFPPGSTFKPFVAIAGLAEGAIRAADTITCNGHLQFGKHDFHCWKAHGVVNLEKGLEFSCNSYFYRLGLKLGVDAIAKYARAFGLGERTGIDLPTEQSGLIPDSQWKLKTYHQAWQSGESLSIGIGQGFVAVTPLQMALAYAAIGNGGNLYRPYLVRKIKSPGGNIIFERKPQLVRHVDLPAGVLQAVQSALDSVVNIPGATGYHGAHSDKIRIAGKTGTAQMRQFANMAKVSCPALPKEFRHHAWFLGFAPAVNPKIAVAVFAEHGCHGAANPVAKEVMEAYLAADPDLALPAR